MKRASSYGRDTNVGSQAAIRIDLMRGKRQHRAVDGCGRQTIERTEEELDVASRFLEIRVRRNDVEDEPFLPFVCGSSDKQRLRRRCQAGDRALPRIEAAAGECRLEERSQIQRSRNRGRHIRQLRDRLILSRRLVVECPVSSGMNFMLPPYVSTNAWPGFSRPFQSEPFTRISGLSRRISVSGVCSGKITTASTA